MTVEEVIPKPESTNIQEGIENELVVDLDVQYVFNTEATSVFGEGLWTTKMWMSSTKDGANELAGTVVEEVLTEGQQSQDLKKNPSTRKFTINDIRYRFNLKNHRCDDARFVCAKFNKGPNPKVEKDYLDFHFSYSPAEEVLTGCAPIENCRGKPVQQNKTAKTHIKGCIHKHHVENLPSA